MDDLIDFNEFKREPQILNNDCKKEEIWRVQTPANEYQLDNYYRNAMLLFCDYGAWIEDLTRTFQKYRFIIDKYLNLTSVEIEERCASFFSRNFFEYGAVAVVIFEPEVEYTDVTGMLQARDKSYHESVILKYLTTDVPVSLRGKPKIYITKNTRVSNRVAIDDYEDILALHLPFETNYRDNLISKLCKNMDQFGENGDLLEIVKDSIREKDDTAQKIEAICEFVGQEYADLLAPFFSDIPSHDTETCPTSALKNVPEKPKLFCTLKKRLILPVDIYCRLGDQPTQQSTLHAYKDKDGRPILVKVSYV